MGGTPGQVSTRCRSAHPSYWPSLKDGLLASLMVASRCLLDQLRALGLGGGGPLEGGHDRGHERAHPSSDPGGELLRAGRPGLEVGVVDVEDDSGPVARGTHAAAAAAAATAVGEARFVVPADVLMAAGVGARRQGGAVPVDLLAHVRDGRVQLGHGWCPLLEIMASRRASPNRLGSLACQLVRIAAATSARISWWGAGPKLTYWTAGGGAGGFHESVMA